MAIRAGLDEVGWGSFAGPVISVVAAYDDSSLPLFPTGVKDSKRTTDTQRRGLYLPLCHLALSVGIGHAWPFEIDGLGPGVALQLSHRRAVEGLEVIPDVLIIDGDHDVPAFQGKKIVEPKADARYIQVSAASIIAKHFRDEIMRSYAQSRRSLGLPDYNWAENKGYGTPDHIDAIQKYGLVVDANDKTPDHSLYLHRIRYCRKLKRK